MRDSGYRDLNGALDSGVAAVANLVDDPQGVLPLPGQDVVAAVNTAFPEVRKRAQVLFLVDVSGSMDEPISATETKLTAAKDAIALALDHFTAGDNVGLAAFAQAEGGALVPGAVSPIADIGTSRDAFLGALGGLQSMGDTPLYQAVDTFAAQQAQSWSPDRITAIVVLSDGENDTPTPPRSAPTRCSRTWGTCITAALRCWSSRSPTARTPTSPRCSPSRARRARTTTTPPTRPRSRPCSGIWSRASDPRTRLRGRAALSAATSPRAS